jgi:flagellar motor switch protein FliM
MSDADILTEEESEALLEQSEQTEVPAKGVHEPGADFWELVAPDRIPEFEAISEEIAEAVSRIWAQMFGRGVVVTELAARRQTGRAIARDISFEQGVRSFDLEGRGEQCLLLVQPDTVSAMVDLCFGGKGEGKRSERLSGLTEMEARLFARFCDGMRDRLTEVWRKRANCSLSDSAEEFSVSGHSLCESGARVVVSPFEFDIGQNQQRIELIWPATLIDKLRERKAPALPAAQQRPELDWATRMREEVRGAKIEVRAVIDGIPLRLHQISSARSGDIIMTEPLDKVRLLAGNKAVFEGTLGTHNGLNAVKISQPFRQKRSGDA